MRPTGWAVPAMAAGDADTATWAACQALLATPAQLSLFETEMRAAASRATWTDPEGPDAGPGQRRPAGRGPGPRAPSCTAG